MAIKNKTKKNIVYFALAITAIVLWYVIFYAARVWNDAQTHLKGISANVVAHGERAYDAQSLLEQGSLVRLEALKHFILFSRDKKSPEAWIQERQANEDISIEEGEVFLQRDIQLLALNANVCMQVNCLQIIRPFSEIPSILWRGLIGIEDARFLDHKGVDYKSILRAIIVDIYHMKFVQGGSTITQQLVKNKFLSTEKSLVRKFHEVIYAIVLELFISKPDILTLYLNEMYWGTVQGLQIKGVHAAAMVYFGKKPSDLSSYEVSILISMLKGPGLYNPRGGAKRLKERSDYVHKTLQKMNLISQKNAPWSLRQWEQWLGKIRQIGEQSYLRAVARSSITQEGFQQFYLNSVAETLVKKLRKQLDVGQVAIKVFAQKLDLDKPSLYFYSQYERDLKTAIEKERHQVGSILKPIFYQLLVDSGSYRFSDKVDTREVSYELKSGKWSPKAKDLGRISLKRALEISHNGALVRLVNDFGFERFEGLIEKIIPRLQKPLEEYPAQILGSVELTVIEVFEIYKRFIKKRCLTQTEEQQTVFHILADPSRTTTANYVNDLLSRYRFFGKTGTSNNGFDNWYVSFDGQLLYIIWVGNEGDRSKGSWETFGASTAFALFQDFWPYRGVRLSELQCIL